MKKLFRLLAISFFSLLCGIGVITTQKQEVTPVFAVNEPVALRAAATDQSDVEKDLNIEFAEASIAMKTTETKTVSYAVKSRTTDYTLTYGETHPSTYVFNGVTYELKIDAVDITGVNTIYARKSSDGKSVNIWSDNGENASGTVIIDVVIKAINITPDDYTLDSFHLSSGIHVTISKPVIDTIAGFFKNTSVIIIIATACVTIIGRSAIKIFRFGVNYKSNFATVEQQEKFENSMRQEMRANKTETQDAVLKICLREINRETRPLKDIQEMAEKLKTDREILDIKVTSIDQKYNEIRKLSENINQLEQKVNRLQYGEGTNEFRRSGK